MKLVIIESPFRGDALNVEYAKRCLADSLNRGEAPLASHLLYPGVLDDGVPHQRELGMAAGWAWMERAELVAVYTDRGISDGMRRGVERASKLMITIEYRKLAGYQV